MTPRYLVAGAVWLDLCDERLWLEGEPARLGGKAFALLRALMAHPQMLVTKDELIDEVWNGLAVSDSVLTTAVKEVRQAMQDDARAPVFVETIHRRGYRFMQPVEQRTEDEVPAIPIPERLSGTTHDPAESNITAPNEQRWIAGSVIAALVVLMLWVYLPIAGRAPLVASESVAIHPKSIAVLPFRDLSASSDHKWFADGLTEEVTSRLTRTPDLHVASRLSAGQLRPASASVQSMAQSLGVAHVLDGSVRRAGGRVRVTAELVRTSDGFQLWSQTYDRPLDEVISIQEDIAFRIASAMKTVMQPRKLRDMAAVGTRSVEAYEAFLQGAAADQRSLDTGGREYARAAVAAYESARTLDPDFAEAHWRSAQRWFGKTTRINGLITGQDLSDGQRLEQFLARVDRAIMTSKDETESLKYRSARAVVQMDLRTAHRLLQAYLKARPRDIDAWEDMAERAAYAGERGWMVRAAERIHTLSIEAGEPRSRAITVSAMAMQLDDAVKRARQQIRLRRESAMIRYQAHRAFIWAGKKDEALASLRHILASELPEETKTNARLRQACADGRTEDAAALRKRLDVLDAPLSARWLAAQMVGDKVAAKTLLQPLDNREGLPTLIQYMANPSFDSTLYPVLTSALATAGVTPFKALPMPAACNRTV